MRINVDIIKSTTNAKVVEIKKLNDKKYRKQAKLFICEGVNFVCDIPSDIQIASVFLTPKAELDEKIMLWLKTRNQNYTVVSDEVMTAMSDTPSPSGILCVLPYLIDKPVTSNKVLILDGIKDPGNIGTIIRTAAACGYTDLLLNDCVDVYNPKVIRSTMSGIFRVNILDLDTEKIQNTLYGYEVFALDMLGDNIFTYLSKTRKADKYAVIVGSEAKGISPNLKKIATKTLSLPMEKGVESLNASVSVGIICYLLNNL